MNIFKHLLSKIGKQICNKCGQKHKGTSCLPKIQKPRGKVTHSLERTEPLLTVSQAAKINGVTRQAIHFAIKMKRLNARKENDTWLITNIDLQEYLGTKYSRCKSRNDGELIFDKSKGFYSITEAAKFLNKNTNHIYYLVRMGKLKTHRQGCAIVIQDTELHKYWRYINQENLHSSVMIR